MKPAPIRYSIRPSNPEAHLLEVRCTLAESDPAGQRFALLYTPEPATKQRGAVVYVHPFGEELNKSRRMAALQARAMASAGYSVLQIDLLGCGDSTGDFGDATWEAWLADCAIRNTAYSNAGTTPPQEKTWRSETRSSRCLTRF